MKADGIYLLGQSSKDVTGSQYYIKFGDKQILLECGLYQSSNNSYLESYQINSANFKFNASKIDYVFIGHTHIDHIGLLPLLVKKGFNGRIIMTPETAVIAKDLLTNSCHILESEARILSRKFHREYSAIYDLDDVRNAIELFTTYKINQFVQLDDVVSFKFLPNSHCIGAAQIKLYLKDGTKTKKILYTSDIGAIKTDNHYLSDLYLDKEFNDVVLMESTYGDRKTHRRKRKTDTDLLRSSIETTVGRGGTFIMPCFSFSRTQEILTTLYELFGSDENFKTPIIVDSQLSVDICRDYKKVLYDDDLAKWKEIVSWHNVQFIREKANSDAWLYNPKSKIVISSSGFCTNGRVVSYLAEYLSDKNSTVCFSGYAGSNDSYLSYRIKNSAVNERIKINKQQVTNRADAINLTTFSSHAPHDDLVRYGASFNTNKLVLVHGSADAKSLLKGDLEKEISKNNKTYKVAIGTIGMFVRL